MDSFRQSYPAFEPIYELREKIGEVHSLQNQSDEVKRLAQQYPDDAEHNALRAVADKVIDDRTVDAIYVAEAQRKNIRAEGTFKNFHKTVDLPTLGRKNAANLMALKKVETFTRETLTGLFDGVLDQATAEERKVITAVAERKISSLKQQAEVIDAAREHLSTGQEELRTIMGMPTRRPEVSVPVTPLETAERKNIQEKIIKALASRTNSVAFESDFVRTLFPDEYDTDRPAAYQKFDAMMEQFRLTDVDKLWCRDVQVSFQRGSVFVATESGRPTGGKVNTIYRLARLGDRPLSSPLASSGGDHVILWDTDK